MIDIELLRRDPEAVKRGALAKGATAEDIDTLVRLDAEWRMKTEAIERLRHEQNAANEEVASLPREEKTRRVHELRLLSDHVRAGEEELRGLAEQRERLWKKLPNLPLQGVPLGRDATENVERKPAAALPAYAFPPKDSLDLGTVLGIIDTERSAVASGTRFGALVGDGALLELALVQHALHVLSAEGFTPILPPVLIKREGMEAMGYLERGADEVYQTQDDLLLVGTSEQAIGAMHAGVEFREEELPVRFVAFSSCFRREAGSHGKDVRGILRVHQFDKVEMFSFCHPERSNDEHAFFLLLQERLVSDLGLAYRLVDLCTGDLGFASAATVDLETWFPSRKAFVETHSTSNTTDFQTRRLNTRFRAADQSRRGRAPTDGGSRLVHAVNGTAYAIQRTVAALLETHQQADGTVRIPEALQASLGGRAVFGERSGY